jgi:hypothetical protein
MRTLRTKTQGTRLDALGRQTLIMLAGIILLQFVFAQTAAAQTPARLSGEIYEYTLNTHDSQHYIDTWSKGEVLLTNGEVITDQLLMYNGYMDELIWLHPVTYNTIKVDKNLVVAFRLFIAYPTDTVEFRHITYRYWYQPEPVSAFVTPLHTGSFSLLLRHRIRKSGERAEYTEEGRSIRTLLKADPAYFITAADGRSYPVSAFNRRTFDQIFPDYREEIRQAFRSVGRASLREDDGKAMLAKTLDDLITKKPGY